MVIDAFGSCSCNVNYYLTEKGCQTCQDIIPGCDSCYQTTQNTLLEIYNGANLGYNQRQYYIDCMTCAYANYRLYADIAKK